jgi:hypothetical protein
LDFRETVAMVGFVSIGIAACAIVLLFLNRRFPPETETYED